MSRMEDFSLDILKEHFQKIIELIPKMSAQLEAVQKHSEDIYKIKVDLERIRDKTHISPCKYNNTLDRKLAEITSLCKDIQEKTEGIESRLNFVETRLSDIDSVYFKILTVYEFFSKFKISIIILVVAILYLFFPHTASEFIKELKRLLTWTK